MVLLRQLLAPRGTGLLVLASHLLYIQPGTQCAPGRRPPLHLCDDRHPGSGQRLAQRNRGRSGRTDGGSRIGPLRRLGQWHFSLSLLESPLHVFHYAAQEAPAHGDTPRPSLKSPARRRVQSRKAANFSAALPSSMESAAASTPSWMEAAQPDTYRAAPALRSTTSRGAPDRPPNTDSVISALRSGSPPDRLCTGWRDNPNICLLYTSPSPRDGLLSRMPSSA